MNEVLGFAVGVIFAVLGVTLLRKHKILSSSKYYRILFIVIALMLIGFAIYIAWRSIYLYA